MDGSDGYGNQADSDTIEQQRLRIADLERQLGEERKALVPLRNELIELRKCDAQYGDEMERLGKALAAATMIPRIPSCAKDECVNHRVALIKRIASLERELEEARDAREQVAEIAERHAIDLAAAQADAEEKAKEIIRLDAEVAEKQADSERLLLEKARKTASHAILVQALSVAAREHDIQDFALKWITRADQAAADVRMEDLTVATINSGDVLTEKDER
jgi:septal ring factor EnvC (AmiA/AmiB activator)